METRLYLSLKAGKINMYKRCERADSTSSRCSLCTSPPTLTYQA